MYSTPNAQMQVVLNQAVAVGKAQLVSISAIAAKAGYLQTSEIDAFAAGLTGALASYVALLAEAAREYPALEASQLPQVRLIPALLVPFVTVLKATHARRTTAGDQSILDLAQLLRQNMTQMQVLLLSIPTICE